MLAQRPEMPLPHVEAANLSRALPDIVKTVEQLDRGRLAGACRSDKSYLLSRFDAERYALQHRVAGLIVKPNVVEYHFTAKRLRHRRIPRALTAHRRIARLKNLPGQGT